MVEPTFNTEDIDEFLDRIRIAKLKAEMRGQQQQIDRPSVVTIRRLEVENAKLKEALRADLRAFDALGDDEDGICAGCTCECHKPCKHAQAVIERRDWLREVLGDAGA